MIPSRLFFGPALLATTLLLPAAQVPAPERLLPDDTLAFCSVPDAARFRTFWTASPSTAILRDPAMKPFQEHLWGGLRTNVFKPLEDALLLKADDFRDLAKGQVTFAVVAAEPVGGTNSDPALLMLVDTLDQAPKLKDALAKLRQSWTDAGRTIRTDRVGGAEFMTWTTTDEALRALLPEALAGDGEEDRPARKIDLSVGQSGPLLVIGTRTNTIARVLALQSGAAAPSVAALGAFQTAQTKALSNALVLGWANPQPLLKLALANAPQQGGVSPKRIVDLLGLGGLKSASFALKADEAGSLVEFFLGQPSSERQGLLALLAGAAKPSAPPAFVPADVLSATRWRIDFAKLWQGIESAVKGASPAAEMTLKMVIDSAGKEANPDFDLRKELFAQLGDDLVAYQKPPIGSSAEELEQPRSVILIGSPAPERLAKGIKALAETMTLPGMLQEREVDGKKIYTLSSESGGVQFAPAAGYLAISSDTDALLEFLRRGEDAKSALRDREGLAAAAEKVGGLGTGFFVYQNAREQNRLASRLAKLSEDAGLESPLQAALGEKFGSIFDHRLYPPFDQIEKHFGFVVMGGEADADGFRLRVYTPVPAGAK